MSLQLLTAPAGAGKTQYVIEQIQRECAEKPLPRILVILPSGAQVTAFRERLGKLSRPVFGVTLTDFHALYHSILDEAGMLPRLLPEAARYRVMRYVLRFLVSTDSLSYFAPIADKPGLISAISNFIAELKQARVQPEGFVQLASTARAHDLAVVYSAYQDFLRAHELADREGMGWLALAALESNPQLYDGFDYVVADGFDEFNPTQLELLNFLAARLERLDVTLTYQRNRRAHARFANTLMELKTTPTPLEPLAPPRVMPLEHLEQSLFEINSPRVQADEAITLTVASDRVREARIIGRHVKQLLLDGVLPSQIGVVFRQLAPYQSIVREVFNEYGIPFRLRAGMSLATNPLIAALLNLLTLSANEFPWRETLDAMRSPYFLHRELDTPALAQIERIVREGVVTQGRAAWLDAFTKPTEVFEDDEHRARVVDELSEAELTALRDQVEVFFAKLTPAESGTAASFVAHLEGLIGPDPRDEAWQREHATEFVEDIQSLRVVERARQGDADLAARDLTALAAFKDVLRGILEAAAILSESEITWRDLISDLIDAVSIETYDVTPTADGRVLIASVTQARGVPKPYIFLGGLIESEFPQRAPQDLLLMTSERTSLRASNIPLADLQVRDETTLFYEAATLAREKIALSYPSLDDDANPLYPSPYIHAVVQLFQEIPTVPLRIDTTPDLNHAASFGEFAVALTLNANQAHARAFAATLQEISPAWRNSLWARRIEARRESAAACDEYSGVLRDEVLRAFCARQFGTNYAWSATQLNDWGACGFRFFAKRLLKLTELTEPEKGLERWQLGAVYHKILQETFNELASRGMMVNSETLDAARAMMEQHAQSVLDQAPQQFAFRVTAWWQQERAEIVRRLQLLLKQEAARNDKTPSLPFKTELPFDVRIKNGEETLRLHGKIDRLDRTEDGLVLIDYKSGTTPISVRQVQEGRNLQLPVYVLAAEALGESVADAFFFHIANGKIDRALPEGEREVLLETVGEHITRYVTHARRGEFAVKPTRFSDGACHAFCEFAGLCRVGRWSAHKGDAAHG